MVERSQTQDTLERPVRIIRPQSRFVPLNMGELWSNRQILWMLVWRTIKSRYKQTVIGVAWAVLQPFSLMIIYSIFMGQLLRVPTTGDLPYPLFIFTNLVLWLFFANSVSSATSSLVQNSHLITKVYFPRIYVPLSYILAALVDLATSFLILLIMRLAYGFPLTPTVLLAPVYIMLAFFLALGVSLWFSALYVQYRDVQYVIPLLLQVWMYISPVIYAVTLITDGPWQSLMANPMFAIVSGFAYAVNGVYSPPVWTIIVSVGVIIMVLAGGLFFFRRVESRFIDVI